MLVYESVRRYLDERGIKQKAIAEAARIPNVTLNAMLNGRRKMYADDLRAICIALGVSADTFVNASAAEGANK